MALAPKETQAPSIDPESDEGILAEMASTGEASEGELADVQLNEMLKEEADAGRIGDDRNGPTDGADLNDEPAAVVEAKPAARAQPSDDEISRSARRRAQRQEASARLHREVENKRQQINALKEQLAAIKKKAEDQDPAAYGDNTAAYAADRAAISAEYAFTKGEIDRTTSYAKQAADEAGQLHKQSYDEYMGEGGRKYADFVRTVTAPELVAEPMLVQALLGDGMHDVAYALAKRPSEWNRLAALTPVEQAREIVKVETQLRASKKSSRTSAAPEPIRPVKGGGSGTAAKSPKDMSYREYAAWRTKGGGR